MSNQKVKSSIMKLIHRYPLKNNHFDNIPNQHKTKYLVKMFTNVKLGTLLWKA